ncbi:MAG: hypothetical protein E7368_00035 [Clostridiales bacterium]|nr:hypothetical protein [Clostridiales bacterium]
MASIEQNGTTFTFSVLPLEKRADGFWARTETALKNPYISYQYIGEEFSKEEIENWIFSMFRFLAGGYAKERSLSFEKAGLAIDFYPYTANGGDESRHVRRANDCVMAIRLLMRDNGNWLGGVYSVMLHRKEIESFALALREEFVSAFARFEKKRGKYLFVGVSPEGYKGCNYWYLDKTKKVKAGDYVWVIMGRHKTKQIVYVDSVRFCDEDTSPCEPDEAKCVLRIANDEEIKEYLKG